MVGFRERLVDGSGVRGEGNRVMKGFGFYSWVDNGLIYEMGKTEGEASLGRIKPHQVSCLSCVGLR